jgi:hypothetical protein
MAEATANKFEAERGHPTTAKSMDLPQSVGLDALAAKSMSMAPRSGVPTPPAATTEATPSGPGGINKMPAAPVMPNPATARSALAPTAPADAPQRLETVQSTAEAVAGAQGPLSPRPQGQTYGGGRPVGDRR